MQNRRAANAQCGIGSNLQLKRLGECFKAKESHKGNSRPKAAATV
jgi:hypothetical protein